MSADDGGAASGTRAGFVALLGWTNVGKSSLLNRLVGTRLAAVADASQTTRRPITGVRTLSGRGQLVFVDTPGLHRPRYKMNRSMVAAAQRAARDVDLALFVIDAARGPGQGDRSVAQLLKRNGVATLAVLNKIDLVRPKTRLLPMMRMVAEDWELPDVIPVSALTGEGCDNLLERLLAMVPEGPAPFPEDFLTDQPEQDLAAEWIREKLVAFTRQELPHATAVVIEGWQVRDDGLLELQATVFVERESQKKIVIGRKGELLKRVGTAAREELERSLGRRVFLSVRVKVRPDWRNDDRILRRLGL